MNNKKKTAQKTTKGQLSISLFTTKKHKPSLKDDRNEKISTDNIKRKQDIVENKEITKRLKLNPHKNDEFCQKSSLETIKNVNDKQTEELDDLFSDNWDDELDKIDMQLKELDLSVWQRCKVVTIEKINSYTSQLLVKSLENKNQANCLITGVWADCDINVGDILSLIAEKINDVNGFQIDNNNGMLVHWPDTLVSGTAVVGSLFCKRKAILSDRFKGIDGGNKCMVIGSLVHELFQSALKNNVTELEEIRINCRQLLKSPDTIYRMYDADMNEKETLVDVMKFAPQISHFAKKYVSKNKTQEINNKTSVAENSEWDGVIDRIVDIEENIWSPRLGLKGKVDVSVEVTIHDRRTNGQIKKYMPLELKTGKQSTSAEHRGQVILYTMLMTAVGGNSIDEEVKDGILVYLKDTIGIHQVPSRHSEKRDLLMLRNQLVYYLVQNHDKKKLIGEDIPIIKLPEPINHHSACGKCPYLTLCSVFLSKDPKIMLAENHPLTKLKQQAIGHLEDVHIKYFLHWCCLLILEESERQNVNSLKDLWTLPPQERENHGKCLINMVLTGIVTQYGDHFEHVFKKYNSEKKLSESLLQVGEAIIVNTEKKIAVSVGSLSAIDNTTISLLLDRDLRKRNNLDTIYTLDLYESQSVMSHNLTNLGVLLDDTEISKKLKRLIIEKQPATFCEKLPKEVALKGKEIMKSLNSVQKRAILKSLTANDYILIKGMPGTGKTQTIAALIELLVMLGKNILVTSQTHSAVDNVLIRLKSKFCNILRLGAAKRVHPQISKYSEYTMMKDLKSPLELHTAYLKANVVGVTCLGANHSLLVKRIFDVCIVDESTQVLQCSVLRPLFAAKKFVLVGDPDQLPPIVRSSKARNLGMNECLFTRLDGTPATFSLNLQYRMNRSIMRLANLLTYKGQLQCGTPAVENATLEVKDSSENYEKWISDCVSSKLSDSVVVIDTGNTLKRINVYKDELENSEQTGFDNNCHNPCETALVLHIIVALLKANVEAKEIGVITPYRNQVSFIKKLLNKYNSSNSFRRVDSGISEDFIPCGIENVEVNTVDQYQGRDKNVIIYSCTRTSDMKKDDKKYRDNEILEDKRRLTVAITRAKHKLIIIGDVRTLKSYKPFEHLFRELVDEDDIGEDSRWNSFVSLPKMEEEGVFKWENYMSIL